MSALIAGYAKVVDMASDPEKLAVGSASELKETVSGTSDNSNAHVQTTKPEAVVPIEGADGILDLDAELAHVNTSLPRCLRCCL